MDPWGWGATPTQRKLLVDEEFVSGGSRNRTPHLIHHFKSLTVPFPIVFREESRGYDPESMSPSYL